MLKPATTTYAVGAFYGLTAVSIWAGCLVVAGSAANPALRHGTSPRFASAWLACSCCRICCARLRLRAPWLGWPGGACARRRANGPACQYRPAIRACGPCRRAVSRRDAADGCAARGGHLDGDVHLLEEAWFRPDPVTVSRHRLGRRRQHRHAAEPWPRPVSRLRVWPGPATRWRCGAPASTAFTPPPFPPSFAISLYARLRPLRRGQSPRGSTGRHRAAGLRARRSDAVISYILYGSAVSILGASSGAAFAALCPAMTAMLAIPILGEWPTAIDWLAIVLISAGVYFVSGGPLPKRQRQYAFPQ